METSRREAFGLIATGIGAGTAIATYGNSTSAHAAALPEDQSQWRPLFNGRNLDGWKLWLEGAGTIDKVGAVDIHDGLLHFLGPRYRDGIVTGMGYLITAEEFGNYHLSLEYKWGTRRLGPRTLFKRDSGLLYHVRGDRDYLWPDSIEYQIVECNTGDAYPINHRAVPCISQGGIPAWPRNPPGLPYAPQINAGGNLRQSIRADGNFEDLTGWNTIELVAEGDRAAHLVNGRIVNALYDLQQRDPADPSRYVRVDRGRILLQLECAEIMFRNIRIKPI